jgi:hypothetical protein
MDSSTRQSERVAIDTPNSDPRTGSMGSDQRGISAVLVETEAIIRDGGELATKGGTANRGTITDFFIDLYQDQ